MAFTRVAALALLVASASASAAPHKAVLLRTHVSVAEASTLNKVVMEEEINDEKAINPSFSAEACAGMYSAKKAAGGATTASNHVAGCDKVCDKALELKEYWGTGGMAGYGCEKMKEYGCVYGSSGSLADAAGKGC